MHFAEFEGKQEWDERNWLQRNKELPFKDYYENIL
jgi:hypothetical protein